MSELEQKIVQAVADLEALKFFPTSENGRAAVMKLLARMVENVVQLEWFVAMMIDRIGIYEGTAQMRAVFCQKFRPADGIEAALSVDSPLYRSAEDCELEEKIRVLETSKKLSTVARRLISSASREWPS